MKRTLLFGALLLLVLQPFIESHAAPPFKEYTFGFAGTVPVAADYDGDGRDDLAVYHASSGNWYIFRSSLGFIQEQFGFSGTIPVVGDYDGDGKDDKAVFDPATANWYVFRSTQGFLLTPFGFPGVKPAPGDYDGDGKSDLAVYDAPNGQWYIFRSQLGQWNPQFGFAGTIPVAADYDGDGKTDIAVYNPPSGMWYISRSSLGFLQQQFGYPGPLTAPADFDGDGKADYGLFNTNNHSRIFHTWQSSRGYYTITFPATGLPRPADFEGDGQKKLVVYNPAQGKWFADLTFVDWDLDGLPKSWESAHGLNDQDNGSQNPAHGPGGDPDGDGYQNIYEYLGGSDPTIAGSIPPPTVTVAPGGTTIQQAIDNVNQSYGIIRLGPGTYSGPGNRNISFRGKKLMLVSQAGPKATVLDAERAGRGIDFSQGESKHSVVSGLTIIHGYAADGGGIQCITSSPTIFNCVIKGCEAAALGGGIALFGSSPRVVGCDFIENRAGAGGGAAYFSTHATTSFVLYGSSPVIERCLIEGNRATNGPGIFSADQPATHPYTGSNCATVTLLRCRIAGNVGGTGSGAVQLHDGKAVLDNCIIVGNRASGMLRTSANNGSGVTMKHCTIMNNLASSSPVGSGILSYTRGSDAVAMKNSIVWGNQPGTAQVFADQAGGLVADSCNVDQTPFPYLTNHAVFNNTLQVAPQLGSSGRVKAASPMRNAGSPAFSVSPDIDGEPRDAQPDLGCDEFVDADGDTLPDYWEILYGLSPSVYHDPSGDSDGDGLTNAQEADQETDPLAPDTDGDGLNDAEELLLGTKPLSPDTDDDGLSDGDEVDQGTNPNSADTDGDGIQDPDDPAPNENGLADDLVLYVDSDGGAPQRVVSNNRVVFVPQGTKAVYYKVTVFSREYPQYTATQSQFDDVVTWSMDAPSPLQDQPLTSYHVNALHSQFGPGDFPGGNVVVKEGILNYEALTQHGPSSLNLEATAMNVSDSALGSGVGIQVSILKVDIATDINNDGTIDAADEPIEESGIGEIVRVNDNTDPTSGEDDLQYMEISVEPDLTQGAVWFKYDTSKVQMWEDKERQQSIPSGSESSPTWTLGSGAPVPDHLYVEGITTTVENASIEVTLHLKVGGVDCTDTILFTVTDQVGHYAYFRGVRDYIVENSTEAFLDEVDVSGGFSTKADFRLVGVRADKSTLTVVDAKTPDLADVGQVMASYSQSHIIANGTFYHLAGGLLPSYGPWTYGKVIEGGSELPISSNTPYAITYRGWFAQNTDGSFSWGRGTEPSPTSPTKSALGGIAAFIPGGYAPSYLDIVNAINADNPSQFTSALSHLGLANENDEDILFLLYINDDGPWGQAFPASVDRAGDLFPKLVLSGTSALYGLDGGGSVGVAHVDIDGALDVRCRAPRQQWWLPTPDKVNNYIVITVSP